MASSMVHPERGISYDGGLITIPSMFHPWRSSFATDTSPRLLARLLAGEDLPKARPLEALNRVQPVAKFVSVRQGATADLAEVTVEVSPGREGSFQREGKPVTIKTDVYDLRLFREGQLVSQEPALFFCEAEAKPEERSVGCSMPEELEKAWQIARRVKPVAGRVELDAKTGELTRAFTVRLPHGMAGKEIEFTAYAFNEDRVKSESSTGETLHGAGRCGAQYTRGRISFRWG